MVILTFFNDLLGGVRRTEVSPPDGVAIINAAFHAMARLVARRLVVAITTELKARELGRKNKPMRMVFANIIIEHSSQNIPSWYHDYVTCSTIPYLLGVICFMWPPLLNRLTYNSPSRNMQQG